jgi:signal transduction histidine kinase
VEAATATLGFAPEVVVDGALEDVPEPYEQDLLAVVREGLANVVRHARAHWCRLEVQVRHHVCVTVEDDGVGIPAEAARSGLGNLERRATRLGGSMELRTRTPRGTCVRWQVPLPG